MGAAILEYNERNFFLSLYLNSKYNCKNCQLRVLGMFKEIKSSFYQIIPASFGAFFFVRPQKIILRGGGIVWIKSCLKLLKLLFSFILMNLFLFGFTKTKTGAKTAPRAPKLSYFDGRRHSLVPGLPRNAGHRR